MWMLLGCVIGFGLSFLLPTHCKKYNNRPILSVFIVKLRRSKFWSFLAWQIPFTGDDNWYYDIVEKDVYCDS